MENVDLGSFNYNDIETQYTKDNTSVSCMSTFNWSLVAPLSTKGIFYFDVDFIGNVNLSMTEYDEESDEEYEVERVLDLNNYKVEIMMKSGCFSMGIEIDNIEINENNKSVKVFFSNHL